MSLCIAKFKAQFYKNNQIQTNHFIEKGTRWYKKTLHPFCENLNDDPDYMTSKSLLRKLIWMQKHIEFQLSYNEILHFLLFYSRLSLNRDIPTSFGSLFCSSPFTIWDCMKSAKWLDSLINVLKGSRKNMKNILKSWNFDL